MLNLYRRFNRFFIGDLGMLEEYHCEIEKVGYEGIDVSDFWVETIEFEFQRCGLESAEKLLERALKFMLEMDVKKRDKSFNNCKMLKLSRSMMLFLGRHFTHVIDPNEKFKKMLIKLGGMIRSRAIKKVVTELDESLEDPEPAATLVKFDSEKALPQVFSLPRSLIYQMLKSASVTTLAKLFRTCKAAFHLHRTPLCHQLGVTDEVSPQYFQHSLFIPVTQLDSPALRRLHIVNSLDWIVETDRLALSRLIPRLHRSSAKYIHIDGQDLTMEELEFLASNVQKLHLCDTNVIKSDGTVMTMDEIVNFAPNAQINIDSAHH